MASTDELLFRLSEKMDVIQVHLSAASAGARRCLESGTVQLRAAAARLTAGEAWQAAGQGYHQAAAAASHRWLQLRLTAAQFNPRDLAEKVKLIVFTEVSTVHLCLLGVGFGAGLLLGVCLGRRGRAGPAFRRPALMRAVVCTAYSGADSVELVEDLPRPEIVSPTEVLVKVKAATLDRIDLRIAAGYGRALRRQLNKCNPHAAGELPAVLGRDMAGLVDQVGPQVTLWEVGDPVWAAVPFWRPGTLAEYVVLEEKELSRKPDGVTFERAAALPYSGTVAWDALVSQAGLDQQTAADKRVLIHTASSAVGIIAIQLVKAWGGHVTTTVARRLVPLARMLGADDVIEYDVAELEKELELRDPFDVVLNTAGAALHGSCRRCCAPLGVVVTAVEPALMSDRHGLLPAAVHAVWVRLCRLLNQFLVLPESWGTVTFSAETLAQLGVLVDSRDVQAVVEHTLDPQEARAAVLHLARGAIVAKPVIRFRHPDWSPRASATTL